MSISFCTWFSPRLEKLRKNSGGRVVLKVMNHISFDVCIFHFFQVERFLTVEFVSPTQYSSPFRDNFKDNLEQLRSGLLVHLDPRLEHHSSLYYWERSPAVLSAHRCPTIQQVNITHCASNGISVVSPSINLPLLNNRIEYNAKSDSS